jgi:glycosyltransferase involved in cell wall biosynthesis
LACSTLAGDWIFGAGKFLVLKNSIDIYKFKFSLEARKTVRKSLKIQDDFIVLGHVGMFNEQKNHHKILMVFKAFLSKCPNSRLLLVGDGVLMDEISKEIEKINIGKSVIMTGVRTDIPRLLSAMDIFIFPSKWEGLGLAVIEAQASGLPCLLSDRIPRDVYISDNMKSAALETSSEDWANMLVDMAVEDRDTQSAHNIEKINNAGYNIVTEAGKLKDIYLDIN